MKVFWGYWERGIQVGRLRIIIHRDWFLERPRVDRDETDLWIWCLGFLSVSWEFTNTGGAR